MCRSHVGNTISKLLPNLENILIGLYFKICVLKWCQSHVQLGVLWGP